MWTVCITSIRHVLKLNGYGGPQAKVNGKSQRFKGVGNFSSLFVLSYRISTHAHYIIDKYDLCKGKYQGSFSVLNKNNMNNKAIDKLLFLNHHVLIVSKDSATVLKVS